MLDKFTDYGFLNDAECSKGRTIRKVMGGGGGEGEFSSRRNYFSSSSIFFRPQHEYFLGLIGVVGFLASDARMHEFFFIKFSLARIFFVLRPPAPPPPPHKFSNGSSLIGMR